MGFDELISSFAERHGLAGLTATEGAAALDVDGMVVSIVSDGDVLVMSSEIGEPPAEGRAGFADLMLEANLQTQAFFAKTSNEDMYVAVRRLPLQSVDVDALDAALESLANIVETWRRILNDYRPIVEAAEKNLESKDGLSRLSGGFMSV